ncbi:Hsp70 family protein [Mycolicibacterium grossiae]|nr:Hsp70 family protein [Mycolicibacterium grossiae]
MSVGAASFTAVAVDRAAVRRTAVLTLFGHRPPEVGVPAENPALAAERGLVVTDFVDRVGDPVPLVAADGSTHRAEALTADALRAMVHALPHPGDEPVGIAHPAHWRPPAVEALRGALTARPDLARAVLLPDAVAALTALRADPGLPARGVVALCDLGATGTSITLADAAGLTPIAPTVRYPDLSGDLVDQALLAHVLRHAADSADLTGTSAIGSLARLRAQCRAAKERLSAATVTTLTADVSGREAEIRLTRGEVDDVLRQPLADFLAEIRDVLQRNGVRPVELAAVATTGGGARIPLVTTTLSEHLRVPIVTGPTPQLAAAIGAGLAAVRGTGAGEATALAPAVAPVVAPVAAADLPTGLAPAAAAPALAWSAADEIPDVLPAVDERTDDPDEPEAARPRFAFAEPEDAPAPPPPMYRRPAALLAAGLLAVLLAIGVAVFVVATRDDEPAESPATTTPTGPVTTTLPSTSAAPEPTEAPAAPPATVTPRAPRTQAPAPPPATEAPPPATTEAPPPPATTEAPPPPATTEPPPTTQAPTTNPPVIPTLPYQTIPGLPFVPSPFQPQQP